MELSLLSPLINFVHFMEIKEKYIFFSTGLISCATTLLCIGCCHNYFSQSSSCNSHDRNQHTGKSIMQKHMKALMY